MTFVDNNCSFAANVEEELVQAGAEVTHLYSNASLDRIAQAAADTNLILLGSGPDNPRKAGNYMEILKIYGNTIPIFGICLEFQSIVEHSGGSIGPLDDQMMHGGTVEVKHDGETIYTGLGNPTIQTRYHSLGNRTMNGVGSLVKGAQELIVTGMYNDIVMSVRHRDPEVRVEGVQFHPDSVMSPEGPKLFKNVLKYVAMKEKESEQFPRTPINRKTW